jgi:transposase
VALAFRLNDNLVFCSVNSAKNRSALGPQAEKHGSPVKANWLGQRAAVMMSMVQSAKLNGHDPWAYLKDVHTRLLTQLTSRIDVAIKLRRPFA